MSCKSCNTPCYEQGTDHDICMAYTKKPFTNADRIRAMTDEELCNEYFRILNHQLGNYTDSRLGLLEWLKEEVK